MVRPVSRRARSPSPARAPLLRTEAVAPTAAIRPHSEARAAPPKGTGAGAHSPVEAGVGILHAR